MAASIHQTPLTTHTENMGVDIHQIHSAIHIQQMPLKLEIMGTCHDLSILMMRIKWNSIHNQQHH